MKHFIKFGWPNDRSDIPEEIREYYGYNDELSLNGQLLMRGERIIIPKIMRRDMLKKIHDGHLGIEGCIRRARESIFWPGISADIKQYIKQCE